MVVLAEGMIGVGVSWLTKDWTGADWSVGVGVSQAGGQGQSKIKTQTNANYF